MVAFKPMMVAGCLLWHCGLVGTQWTDRGPAIFGSTTFTHIPIASHVKTKERDTATEKNKNDDYHLWTGLFNNLSSSSCLLLISRL